MKMIKHTQAGTDQSERNRDMPSENVGEPAADTPGQADFGARERDAMSAESDAAGRDGSRFIGDAEQRGNEMIGAVRDTVSTTLRSVGAIGDDAVMVTRDVLKDTITATEDVGIVLVDGVANLANNVVHGISGVGDNTVNTVTHLLVGVVGGIRQVAGAAVGGVRTVVSESMPRSSSRSRQPMAEEAGRERPPPDQELDESAASAHA
jgi:hypothetical protein